MDNQKFKKTQETKCTLIDGAWLMANTLLWNCKTFNEAETELVKEQIAEYILNPSAIGRREKFLSFCERVLLAYQYLQRNNSRFVPHPLKWLSPHYEHGFEGTKSWYLDLLHERQYIIVHRFELKVFAEALYLYLFKPNKEGYQKALKALKAYADDKLIQAFNNIIITYHYGN